MNVFSSNTINASVNHLLFLYVLQYNYIICILLIIKPYSYGIIELGISTLH